MFPTDKTGCGATKIKTVCTRDDRRIPSTEVTKEMPDETNLLEILARSRVCPICGEPTSNILRHIGESPDWTEACGTDYVAFAAIFRSIAMKGGYYFATADEGLKFAKIENRARAMTTTDMQTNMARFGYYSRGVACSSIEKDDDGKTVIRCHHCDLLFDPDLFALHTVRLRREPAIVDFAIEASGCEDGLDRLLAKYISGPTGEARIPAYERITRTFFSVKEYQEGRGDYWGCVAMIKRPKAAVVINWLTYIMKTTSETGVCPLCGIVPMMMDEHLFEKHCVKNVEEAATIILRSTLPHIDVWYANGPCQWLCAPKDDGVERSFFRSRPKYRGPIEQLPAKNQPNTIEKLFADEYRYCVSRGDVYLSWWLLYQTLSILPHYCPCCWKKFSTRGDMMHHVSTKFELPIGSPFELAIERFPTEFCMAKYARGDLYMIPCAFID